MIPRAKTDSTRLPQADHFDPVHSSEQVPDQVEDRLSEPAN